MARSHLEITLSGAQRLLLWASGRQWMETFVKQAASFEPNEHHFPPNDTQQRTSVGVDRLVLVTFLFLWSAVTWWATCDATHGCRANLLFFLLKLLQTKL